ncbi:Hypothetical protein SCF082_LOCUS52029 [Durusdinium trenchii]|uniref:Peptidase M48 domain-containing protein n=1 Tax=Durusdinium trenchii TaxID=1381693 RepID=A0ABP0SIH4_9DINO
MAGRRMPLAPAALRGLRGIVIGTGSANSGARRPIWEFWNNRWLRRALRASRIGALSVSIFGVGYTTGVSDVLADPQDFRQKKATSLLKSMNATDAEGHVRLCEDHSEEVKAVKRVLPRLLRAARAQVDALAEEIFQAIQQGEATRSQEKDLETLQRAQKRLQGWSDHGFLVVDVNTPNAFARRPNSIAPVTPMLPRMVFVHRGIFWVDGLARPEGLQVGKEVYVRRDGWQRAKLVSQHQDQWAAILGDSETVTVGPEDRGDMRVRERRQLVENDEQLAMLLGHELAHAVHDHGYESLGIWTTAYSYAFVLPLGRCDEMEADATGLQICARAGYDPRLATEFMERFASFQAPETISVFRRLVPNRRGRRVKAG